MKSEAAATESRVIRSPASPPLRPSREVVSSPASPRLCTLVVSSPLSAWGGNAQWVVVWCVYDVFVRETWRE